MNSWIAYFLGIVTLPLILFLVVLLIMVWGKVLEKVKDIFEKRKDKK